MSHSTHSGRAPRHLLALLPALAIFPITKVFADPAITVGPVVNTNSFANDSYVNNEPLFEPAISINRANPSNLVAYSNILGNGLYRSYSVNGGQTWDSGIIGDGVNDTSIPTANTDPSAASDSFGNQFITYMDTNSNIVLAVSTDNGQHFSRVTTPASFNGPNNDQPTVVTGPGPTQASRSVWLSWRNSAGQIVASGAMINGSGAGSVGNFTAPVTMKDSAGNAYGSNVNFGDITVGPGGNVAVTYQDKNGNNDSTANVFVNTSTAVDFVHQTAAFGNAVTVTSNALGGLYRLPAFTAANTKHLADAEAGLAWDTSSGPNNNRLYMVYTIADPANHNDTDIMRRVSTDGGKTWSNEIRVQDFNTNSQFDPRIAVDPKTGYVAVSWYDTRNDKGDRTGADTDGTAQNETQFFATVSFDGGSSFIAPDLLASDRSGKNNPSSNAAGFADSNNDYGDYSGLDFYNNTFYPAWIDNSNSTNDNFFGTGHQPDVYTVAVLAPEPAGLLLSAAVGLLLARRGRRYQGDRV